MVAIGLIWSLKNRVPQRPHVNRKIQLRDQNQTDPTLDGSKIKIYPKFIEGTQSTMWNHHYFCKGKYKISLRGSLK